MIIFSNIILVLLILIGIFLLGRKLFFREDVDVLHFIGGITCIVSVLAAFLVVGYSVSKADKLETYTTESKEIGIVKITQVDKDISFYYIETESGNIIPIIGKDASEKKLKDIFFSNVGVPKGGKAISYHFGGSFFMGQKVVVYYHIKKLSIFKKLGIKVQQRISVHSNPVKAYDLDILYNGGLRFNIKNEVNLEEQKTQLQ